MVQTVSLDADALLDERFREPDLPQQFERTELNNRDPKGGGFCRAFHDAARSAVSEQFCRQQQTDRSGTDDQDSCA